MNILLKTFGCTDIRLNNLNVVGTTSVIIKGNPASRFLKLRAPGAEKTP